MQKYSTINDLLEPCDMKLPKFYPQRILCLVQIFDKFSDFTYMRAMSKEYKENIGDSEMCL